MNTIKAIYDGTNLKPFQTISEEGTYQINIIFNEFLKKKAVRPPFEYGSMSDKMWMADDFNAPLDDFKEYME